MMPKVASEIAEPLSKANKITMISDGSGDIGAAKLTGELFFSLNSQPPQNLTQRTKSITRYIPITDSIYSTSPILYIANVPSAPVIDNPIP